MKHHVSVYTTRTGQLIANLSRVFDTVAEADAYKVKIKAQYTGITIL